VPRFLATIHIVRDPKKYGMDLGELQTDQNKALGYETVKTNKSMRLQDIAEHLNISEELLCQLNPELRYKITPEKDYLLKVPAEMAEKFVQVADAIPHWEQLPHPPKSPPVVITHRVKRGESLASIAKKYRTSSKAIRNYNHLSAKKGITAGQHLSIPIRGAKATKKATYQKVERNGKKNGSGVEVISYRVKKGDTLAKVAEKNNTTIQAIKETNRLRKDMLLAGQVIRIVRNGDGNGDDDNESNGNGGKKARKNIRGAGANKNDAGKRNVEKTYVVKKGDSLYGIARNHDMDIKRLCNLNNITGKKHQLRAGEVLIIE